MLTAGLSAFSLAEERRKVRQPFLTTGEQIFASQRISQLL
jgi:hypothetical protein